MSSSWLSILFPVAHIAPPVVALFANLWLYLKNGKQERRAFTGSSFKSKKKNILKKAGKAKTLGGSFVTPEKEGGCE